MKSSPGALYRPGLWGHREGESPLLPGTGSTTQSTKLQYSWSAQKQHTERSALREREPGKAVMGAGAFGLSVTKGLGW